MPVPIFDFTETLNSWRKSRVGFVMLLCQLLFIGEATSANLLIAGNSLTNHAPEADFGVTCNRGISTSKEDNAFVQLSVAKPVIMESKVNVPHAIPVRKTEVGVFYFPGWQSTSPFWNDIKGSPNSRSPNVPWPDREPLLGYYAEEDIKIAEQHIEWASQYGVTFFSYDWYWSGNATWSNHALENHLKASNSSKLKFSLLWANHSEVPRKLIEFDAMVDYWVKHYLTHPQFYRINEKPVIFVFSNNHLEVDASKFGWTVSKLLKRADDQAKNAGLEGIFFVAINDALPTDVLEDSIENQGYSAYTGWCNVGVQAKSAISLDYQVMVDAYQRNFDGASQTKGNVFYIPPASPGRDSRPWLGKNAQVRADATPLKFRSMLQGAKAIIDSHKNGVLPLVMIQSWNEFGEGAYIEPSKKYGFEYLDVTRDVLGK